MSTAAEVFPPSPASHVFTTFAAWLVNSTSMPTEVGRFFHFRMPKGGQIRLMLSKRSQIIGSVESPSRCCRAKIYLCAISHYRAHLFHIIQPSVPAAAGIPWFSCWPPSGLALLGLPSFPLLTLAGNPPSSISSLFLPSASVVHPFFRPAGLLKVILVFETIAEERGRGSYMQLLP